MKLRATLGLATAVALTAFSPGPAQALPLAVCDNTTSLTMLSFNDFHGRIAASSPDTLAFVATIEEQRASAGEANTLVVSGGDSVGASLFNSFVQNDQPTIELLNALDLDVSAVGNHEFDQGWSDLRDRIAPGVNFPYLVSNVIDNATGKSVLPGYTVVEKAGLKIGFVGGVTGDLPSLVSPAGLTGLTVTDPVPAMNSVIADLKDGNAANGEADVVVAVIHEGAANGSQTLAQNVAASPAFASIINNLDARAQVVINAHTHQTYAYDAPNGGGTRPVYQSGSYASNVGKLSLNVDATTGATCSTSFTNLAVPAKVPADAVQKYPRVAEAKTIVDAAIAKGNEIGQQVIGKASAPISRALTRNADGTISDDRSRESTLSNLVAQMFADVLGNGDPDFIGMQNPGGTRADFDKGPITYAEAAAILPFANSLMTIQLTGAQVKTVLEQQWQRDALGNIPTRPYLQLGLSKNVTYTYDASLPEGSRITSIRVNGAPIKPKKLYTIGSGSFLIAGGDNFREIANGINQADSGRADLEAWVQWIKDKAKLKPSFVKQAVSVHTLPTTLKRNKKVSFTVGVPQDTVALDTLDFKTNGVDNDTVFAFLKVGNKRKAVGFGDVDGGKATVTFKVPKKTVLGKQKLVLKTYDSRTVITIGVTVTK